MTREKQGAHAGDLDDIVQRTLRRLPQIRAPQTLQERVLREIERRTQPWWHHSFAAWPLPAKTVFLLASVALIKLSIDTSMWLIGTSAAVNMQSFALFTDVHALIAVHSTMIGSIPSNWWYYAMAVMSAACASAVGIGTLAWRTLYVAR